MIKRKHDIRDSLPGYAKAIVNTVKMDTLENYEATNMDGIFPPLI